MEARCSSDMSVTENLATVNELIKESAERSGRKREDITLVAVSKTVDIARIQEAVDAGQTVLGENRVQEMVAKIPELPHFVQWHLIGRLQKNKVKYIIKKSELIHSLCSFDVAKEIDRLSKKEGVITPCLLQINIGHEASKQGLEMDEVDDFIETLAELDSIYIKGLMAIAPQVEDPEDARSYFREMKDKFDSIKEGKNVCMKYLSMGMSHDFQVAIEEGANVVRIGSKIFGERIYL